MSRSSVVPKSFFELYSKGNALEEEIDDFIHEWHVAMKGRVGSDLVQLHDFLGMSQDEFDVWIQDSDALPHILNSRLEGRSIEEVMTKHVDDMLLAARAVDKSSIIALRAWLDSRNARTV